VFFNSLLEHVNTGLFDHAANIITACLRARFVLLQEMYSSHARYAREALMLYRLPGMKRVLVIGARQFHDAKKKG